MMQNVIPNVISSLDKMIKGAKDLSNELNEEEKISVSLCPFPEWTHEMTAGNSLTRDQKTLIQTFFHNFPNVMFQRNRKPMSHLLARVEPQSGYIKSQRKGSIDPRRKPSAFDRFVSSPCNISVSFQGLNLLVLTLNQRREETDLIPIVVRDIKAKSCLTPPGREDEKTSETIVTIEGLKIGSSIECCGLLPNNPFLYLRFCTHLSPSSHPVVSLRLLIEPIQLKRVSDIVQDLLRADLSFFKDSSNRSSQSQPPPPLQPQPSSASSQGGGGGGGKITIRSMTIGEIEIQSFRFGSLFIESPKTFDDLGQLLDFVIQHYKDHSLVNFFATITLSFLPIRSIGLTWLSDIGPFMRRNLSILLSFFSVSQSIAPRVHTLHIASH